MALECLDVKIAAVLEHSFQVQNYSLHWVVNADYRRKQRALKRQSSLCKVRAHRKDFSARSSFISVPTISNRLFERHQPVYGLVDRNYIIASISDSQRVPAESRRGIQDRAVTAKSKPVKHFQQLLGRRER
jgi:hypothetical protein